MAHVSEAKKKVVKVFTDLIKEYPIVASVNLEDLPAPQLQNMREQLRDRVVLLMGKRRLMKIAIEQCEDDKPGIESLTQYLRGMPALLFTRENPFSLFKTIQKNKSSAPAKAGNIAPKDVVIPAGPTAFSPGPIIGELGMLGMKTGVENGKVAVKEDKVVVKEGEEINAQVAGILTRLGIEPMEAGLDLVAAYENGEILTRKLLDIDEEQYINDMTQAHRYAFNLAMEISYPTTETTELLVTKAVADARGLGVECCIPEPDIVEAILSKASSIATNLKQELKL